MSESGEVLSLRATTTPHAIDPSINTHAHASAHAHAHTFPRAHTRSHAFTRAHAPTHTHTHASGEMALEEFLRGLREHWTAAELELVPYRGRVWLVRGWDALFAQLEEHLSSLATMRQSPYFKAVPEFQAEAALWEERLAAVQAALDAWVDLQVGGGSRQTCVAVWVLSPPPRQCLLSGGGG